MNALGGFLASTTAVLALALLTMTILRRPLNALLIEVCGNESRARFWSVFTAVTIVLVAMLGMLFSLPLAEEKLWAEIPLFPLILSGFRMSLFFLLSALGVLGFVLLLSINSYEHKQRRESMAAAKPSPWSGSNAPS